MQFLLFRETNVLGTFLREWLFSSVDARKFDCSRVVKHVSWVPIILLRFFCISAVCKCDFYLLTGTGQSFDGNWTVCWRKLDYSWRKLDGLLMETGRSIAGNLSDNWRKLDVLLKKTGWTGYGNWKVYWPRLDFQLTVTGRTIDGKSVVYWWKPPADFHHLGSQKMRFYWNQRFRGHLEFFNSFSAFWRLEIAIFAESWNRVQWYEASCEQILRILAYWKCDFRRLAKPMFQGTSKKLWKIFHSWGLNMRICPVVKIRVSRVPSFV